MSFRIETVPVGQPPRFDVRDAACRRVLPVDPALRPAFLAQGNAAEALEHLLNGGAFCVTTGQQPGLFSGPLYTVYKAMTAVAVARRVSVTLGRPVVPVFWVAGDDHDFAESSRVSIVTTTNEVEQIPLRDRPDAAPQLPLYREMLGAEVAAALQAVDAGTPDTEFKREMLSLVGRHYRPDVDMASAFAGFLAELLAPFGLVVFQPYHIVAKQAAAPHMVGALQRAAEIDGLLADRAAQLRNDGASSPIRVGSGDTVVMIEAEQGRDRLVLDQGGFIARRSGQRWSTDVLVDLVRSSPGLFSPNVLLRPAVEAALLPTLAYVGGPGELEYLPQSDPLFAVLDTEPQARIARWGGAVLEHRVGKVLEKLAISIGDLTMPEGRLEARLVRDEIPDDASEPLRRLRQALSREFEQLASAGARLDPTLEKPIRSEAHRGLRGVEDIEKKLIGHLKKRNATIMGQIAKARSNVYPSGRPQERVLNVLPYLVRYGYEFLDAIFEQCAAWSAALETTPGDT